MLHLKIIALQDDLDHIPSIIQIGENSDQDWLLVDAPNSTSVEIVGHLSC